MTYKYARVAALFGCATHEAVRKTAQTSAESETPAQIPHEAHLAYALAVARLSSVLRKRRQQWEKAVVLHRQV